MATKLKVVLTTRRYGNVEEDMPIEETHMMPDGTEMPGATHEEVRTWLQTEKWKKNF
jgi:hypothetical protein